MEENDKTYHREELEMLSTQALDDLLRAELGKISIDENLVNEILNILEKREADLPVEGNIDVDAAWKEFQERYIAQEQEQKRAVYEKPRRWLGRVAAIAAILCVLVFAVPKAMGIEWIAEIIGRWTQDFFEFFDPTTSSIDTQETYSFTTSHPGLQQVYDVVLGLGITEPVVPMWIPEEFELADVDVVEIPEAKRVTAFFLNNTNDVTVEIIAYDDEPKRKHFKDDINATTYEISGIKHYIIPNDNRWVATWVVDDVECSISIKGQESLLYSILRSVYKEDY